MATVDRLPVIAVAADPVEFRGLLRHVRVLRPLDWGLGYAREAELAGRRWILAAHGAGPRLAGAAAETALDRTAGRAAVLSTGFCGAVDPGLPCGAIFTAREVIDGSSTRRYPASLPASAPPSQEGLLWSQDRAAVSPEEKAALRRRGADAVDMEAAAVAEQALRRHVPFFCVRVVSDAAADPLPLDFNSLRDPSGRFSKLQITCAALMHPSRLIPLLRFGRRCRRAADILGEFLAACHF